MISRKTRQAVFVDQPWLHGVVGILSQAIVVLDQSHRILAASKGFCQLVGATPQSAAGRSLRDVGNRFLNSAGLEEFLDMIEPRSTTADHHYQLEIDAGLPGGRAFLLTAQRIPQGLASGMTIVVIEEVSSATSTRATADSPTSRADQRALFSIAAADHDLRQPLQTLGLLQGVLAAREKDPDLRALIARIEEAIEALTGMLNAIVSMNQLNTGSIAPTIQTFPIGLVINRLRIEMAYHAAARGLEWRVVSSKAAVRTDPQLLGQVLRALLMDAMKLIAHGKVLFGCRRRGNQIALQVWISGTGVSVDRQVMILNEFHNRPSSSGHGVVATLVKSLSDRLKLAVKARTRPGSGLVFSAEVPIESPFADAAIRSDATSKGTILVVSNDSGMRDSLALLLREMGHETLTTTADDGFASLLSGKRSGMRPEIVIVDFGQARELNRKIVPSLRWMLGWDIPAIATGGDALDEKDAELVGQPCAYLPRPVRPSELTPLIARFLALVRHRAALSKRADRQALRQTVFVVDDDGVLRDAVRDVLGHQGQQVELFSDCESFLAAYHRDRRGCLVIDNRLPGMSGIELLERLKSEGSTLPSVMITGHGDISTAVRALKAGAIDYIEKPISYESLLAAVERALEIDRGSADVLIRRRELTARLAELTPRERQVMDLVVAGRSSKNIAQILKISQRTVENHRAAIMKRAGAASLPDLIRIVMQLQLSEDH